MPEKAEQKIINLGDGTKAYHDASGHWCVCFKRLDNKNRLITDWYKLTDIVKKYKAELENE